MVRSMFVYFLYPTHLFYMYLIAEALGYLVD